MIPVWLTDTVTPNLHRALHYTNLWGLEGIELRTVGGPEDRVPEVNEKKVVEQLRDRHVLVAAINPSLFEGPVAARAAWMNDLIRLDEALRFAERLGCPRIVIPPFAATPTADVDAMAEALRRASDRAAGHDVHLALAHGPATGCPTGAALADLLIAIDRSNVRAVWDPAAAVRAGEDPAEGIMALGERISLVRCSNGTITEDGHWTDTLLTEGMIDWSEQLQLLDALGFRGPLSLEVYTEPRPKAGVRDAATLIRHIRSVHQAAASSAG
ncbi:sugar phosphate isomerase/epimerase family protein [Salisaeta longa]|uniref:sugar phosphate isomerase/epimerase family protein n=1 Tax=Salisaeta longa TaxID=503170 RepID=UPI0003B7421D|nr:sugar phosphate isomerase/epimerase [Salisaeta longa]